MIKIDYSGLDQRWPELVPAARLASELFEAEAASNPSRFRVEWKIYKDTPDRKRVSVETSDGDGAVMYGFLPEELSKPEHLRIRLRRLWGDMLMIQSHIGIDNLRWQYSA